MINPIVINIMDKLYDPPYDKFYDHFFDTELDCFIDKMITDDDIDQSENSMRDQMMDQMIDQLIVIPKTLQDHLYDFKLIVDNKPLRRYQVIIIEDNSIFHVSPYLHDINITHRYLLDICRFAWKVDSDNSMVNSKNMIEIYEADKNILAYWIDESMSFNFESILQSDRCSRFVHILFTYAFFGKSCSFFISQTF